LAIMFYKETSLKDTAIGKIPNDWNVVRLGDDDVAKITMGQSPPSSTYNKEKNGLPFLQGKMEFGEIYPSTSVYCSEPIKIAESNDVLFSVRAPVGDVNLSPCRLCIGRGLAAIRFNGKVTNHLFCFYYFQKIKKRLEALGKGSTFKAINKDDLENSLVSLPSLSEQQAIVEVLGVVDLAVAKTGEVIAKTERLKKGLMQELLTKGIGHREYKQTPIGRTPKTWQVMKLEEALDQCQYGLSVPSTEGGEYPIVRMDELVDGYVSSEITKSVDLDEKTFRAFKLEKGDILFNRTNSYELVGRTAIFQLEGDYVFASYLIRLRPKLDMFDPHFLTLYLIFSQDRLRQLATRAVHQANINATNLQTIAVPVPPLEEQQKIASILQAMDTKLELEKKEKAKLERIKRGLMDLLLTGKIRMKED